jgi:UDP-glucuronate decarboxylase
MRILVTGGAGFIGSNLITQLLNDGHYVICMDNLSTGQTKNIYKNTKNYKFINWDITKPFKIIGTIDQIYHLACPASPKAYQSDPLHTIDINVNGTINVLNIAKQKNATFLLTSTSEIYGEPTISPQNETYRGNVNTLGIRACYDEGKRMAETISMEYFRCHTIDIKIARIFNTYGPNMDVNDGRVISNIINQCLKSEPITIYGDGTQTRSFCYVDDTVDGLISLMNSSCRGPINIGNPEDITISTLAIKIIRKINSKSIITYLPIPEDDPTHRKPDITQATQKLQWIPKISLNDGLIHTINYFSQLSNKNSKNSRINEVVQTNNV